MTLPIPEKDENFVDFLYRFMSDFNVILEFPEVEQQTAVAEAIFNTTKIE